MDKNNKVIPAASHTFPFVVLHPFGNPLFLAEVDWYRVEPSPFVLAARPARKGISPSLIRPVKEKYLSILIDKERGRNFQLREKDDSV